MGRHYATTKTSIWDDPDFQQLSEAAQRMYWMLTSQSHITSVGMVQMAMKRWSNAARGSTIKGLSKALEELFDAGYIVVDWAREEVLVRSFVRNDGGYTNPQRRKAIQKEAAIVGSKLLSGALAFELDRLGIEHAITEAPWDARSKGHQGVIDGDSMPRGSGYVSTVGAGTLTTYQNHIPEPGADAARSGNPATRIPDDFALSEDMRSWAQREVPLVNIDRHTGNFVDHWRSASRNAAKKDWLAAWRKWMRTEQERAEQARPVGYVNGSTHRASTTDARVVQAFEAGQRVIAALESSPREIEQ